jgi:hypothetical protein
MIDILWVLNCICVREKVSWAVHGSTMENERYLFRKFISALIALGHNHPALSTFLFDEPATFNVEDTDVETVNKINEEMQMKVELALSHPDVIPFETIFDSDFTIHQLKLSVQMDQQQEQQEQLDQPSTQTKSDANQDE